MAVLSTGRGRIGEAVLAAAFMALLAGCDQSAVEIAQEIDAAREGCTEEKLEAGAEECVQMFEKYVDMGSEAIGTYIGAMRALDQALQRRPGLQFDTTGLGHALTPGFAPADSGTPGISPLLPETNADRLLGDRPEWGGSQADGGGPAQAYPDRDPPTYGTEYPAVRGGAGPDVDPDVGRGSGPTAAPGGGGAARLPGRSADPRSGRGGTPRGVLLPPGERLRRPWIGDEDAPPEYYPERADREDAGGQRRPAPDSGEVRAPYAYPPPYPY